MTRTCALRLLTVAAIAVCGSLRPHPLAAQASSRTGVFIAIPETFPDLDARALLVREPGRDVVVLRDAEADAETLAMALLVLERIRLEAPRPTQGQMIPITGFVFRSPIGVEDRRRLERTISELRTRPMSRIGTLGSGQWIGYRTR